MLKDRKDILSEEFTTARDRWADLRLQLMMRFGDQRSDISSRRFYLNISLISIAAAYLTIVVPLVGSNFSNNFNAATVCFFFCTIIGTFDVLWSIRADQKNLTEDNQWRLEVLKNHEEKAAYISSQLLEGSVPEKDLTQYFKDEEHMLTDMRQQSAVRLRLWSTRFLSLVQYVFLLSFFLGFVFLAIGIFPELQSIRF